MSGERLAEEDHDYGPLTRRQAENIADLAARRTADRLYSEIGRNVVSKALFILGAGVLALAVYLSDVIPWKR